MSDRRDDHDHAASIAGLQADVRRIDDTAKREHEYIESVSERSKDTARTVQEIEVQAERTAGRLSRLESDQEKGSERMAKIEVDVLSLKDWRTSSTAWNAGAIAIGTLAAGLLARLFGL